MNLNRVATFVSVVDAGSFTAAAKDLGRPTSSVSRGVSKLEDELGLVLLERTTRSLSLTEAGVAFYERAREALAGLEEASELAGDTLREASGVVRLAAPPEMSGKLVHVVGAFVERHPSIHIDLVTTARGAELVGSGVDIAIVLGPLDDSSLIARRIGRSVHRLYAAPSYLQRRGTPACVGDLIHHDAILYRARAGRDSWHLEGPGGAQDVEVSGPLGGDSYHFVLDAVAAGFGIGLVPEHYLTRCDSVAPLVPVLPELTASGDIQSIVYPSRHLPKRVRLFRDFLVEQLLSCCPSQHVEPAGALA